VSLFEITQQERAWWQRRAAGELGSILDRHPDLPVIAWTVGPAGSVLIGHVNGLSPAAQVRRAFEAWQSALALQDYREDLTGSGTVYLHAGIRRDQVKVRLTATVFIDEGEDR
jgi:hypothetical protein